MLLELRCCMVKRFENKKKHSVQQKHGNYSKFGQTSWKTSTTQESTQRFCISIFGMGSSLDIVWVENLDPLDLKGQKKPDQFGAKSHVLFRRWEFWGSRCDESAIVCTTIQVPFASLSDLCNSFETDVPVNFINLNRSSNKLLWLDSGKQVSRVVPAMTESIR